MSKQIIITSCIFKETCYNANFDIKYIKEALEFDEYEKELAYFQLNKFLDWYYYQIIDKNDDPLININFHFNEKDHKIYWIIESYSENNIDEYFNQYLNKVNEIINQYHIYCEVNVKEKTSWILTGKLIIE